MKLISKKFEMESQNNSVAFAKNKTLSTCGNPGWADSIAKVLNSKKPKSKKTIVLSRAKKLNKQKKDEPSYDFEVEGEVKEVKSDIRSTPLKVEKKESKHKKILSLRVKPSIKDRERERTLKKIATKGVVQLFNAVRIQQKDLDRQLEEAGPLDHKKDAVLNNINKRKFLDVLMSGERAKSELVDNQVKFEMKNESESSEDENNSAKDKKSQWSVLREDFMTNKKLKHWDKEESDISNEFNTDSD